MSMDSHMDPANIDVYLQEQAKQTKETAALYPEYMEQMKKGEKVTIPSTEERKAAALKRAKQNEVNFKKQKAQQKIADKKELEELKKVREQERQRRKKKQTRNK